MKNPYVFGYLPFITIVLFSLTFSIYTLTKSIQLFKVIGVYSGMREFLSDLELKVFLLIVFSLVYFMLFAALKLIAETIHELGMLFFSQGSRREDGSASTWWICHLFCRSSYFSDRLSIDPIIAYAIFSNCTCLFRLCRL